MSKRKVKIAEYHLEALRFYGNTIVKNSYNDEEVVNAFGELGFNVRVRAFESSHNNSISTYGKKAKETHKVIELIK